MLCGAKDFMLSDGLFFCSECGTQSQVSFDSAILHTVTLYYSYSKHSTVLLLQHVREEVTTKDDPSSFVRTIRMSTVKKGQS